MYRILTILILLHHMTSYSAYANEVGDLEGRWRTVRHGALVEITDCGNGTPCATLFWANPTLLGDVKYDDRNRNKDLRNRPLIGVPIFWGFTPSKNGWGRGRLYNPDDGKTFRAFLRPLSATELRVTGCLGPFCRSQTWLRIDTRKIQLNKQ
ncbi:MAG: DUF2147 domain-containing protein [Robiginitomaculum sp.]|nr:DUF2147 domain-containing protein [Robiginitomaculum sp.]